MIRQTLLALLLGCSCSGGSDNKNLINRTKDTIQDTLVVPRLELPNTNTKQNDTIFIHRKVTKDYYHAIYLDTSRQSKYYDLLTNFEFDEYDKQSCQANYKYAKSKYPKGFRKRIMTNLPKNWLPVYRYKNEYCLYAPSDWGNAGRIIINDSSFVSWYMEGPMPFPLQFIKQITGRKYLIQWLNTYSGDVEPLQLTIHIINRKTKLSVFEFSHEPDRYQLFVPADSAKNYDLVVNYCDNQKQMEFEFDRIDYEKLINSH